MRCCEFSCRVFIWKRCFGNLNLNTTKFPSPPDDDGNSDYDTHSDSYSYSDSDVEVLDTIILDDKNYLQMNERGIDTNIN